jgi:hypothetical protein
MLAADARRCVQVKERIKELIKDRTPVDRRSAIFNFSDQADYAPLLQVRTCARTRVCRRACARACVRICLGVYLRAQGPDAARARDAQHLSVTAVGGRLQRS